MVSLKKHIDSDSKELNELIFANAEICRAISRNFHRNKGKTENKNVFGETQESYDIYANNLFREELKKSHLVKLFASEEEGKTLEFNSEKTFCISVDPIDGSGNLEINLSCEALLEFLKTVLQKETLLQHAMRFTDLRQFLFIQSEKDCMNLFWKMENLF